MACFNTNDAFKDAEKAVLGVVNISMNISNAIPSRSTAFLAWEKTYIDTKNT